MDPFSATASAITIVGLLGQSCLFISNFLRDISNAPVNIKHHRTALEALRAGLRKIQALHAENASIIELTPEFSAQVAECLADFVTIEEKLRKGIEKFSKGKWTRVWAKTKWSLSSEHWLGKFLNRVQFYHTIISWELMTLQINISLAHFRPRPSNDQPQIAHQAQALDALVEQRRLLSEILHFDPSMTQVTAMVGCYEAVRAKSTSPVHRGIGMRATLPFTQAQEGTKSADQHARPSAKSTSLRCFLQSYAEPTSIKSNCTYLYNMRCTSLALRFGPLKLKRFSQDQDEIYDVSLGDYYGLSIAIQLPWYYFGRIMLTLYAMRQSHQCLTFSLQWNVSFPRVVPNSAPIMKLVCNRDISGMETLFKAGEASPTDVKSDGTSLLHMAIRTNSFDLVEYLLSKGLNADMTDDEGETPLHLAIAYSSDYNISRLLIEKGADINNSSIDGSSPLHTFFNEVVRRVILCHGKYVESKKKNSRGRMAFHYLAWSSKSTVKDAEAYSFDASILTAQDDEGRSPLHFAAQRGNTELAKYLSTLIPSHLINQTNCKGQTAFHYAVASKRVEILDILKNKGMDVRRKDLQHRSVLHQAALNDNVEAVKRVIAITGRQELEAMDIDGRTPFQLADRHGAHAVVEYLQSTYGLSLGVEAANNKLSDSRLPQEFCSKWRTTTDKTPRGIKDICSAIFALFVLLITDRWARVVNHRLSEQEIQIGARPGSGTRAKKPGIG